MFLNVNRRMITSTKIKLRTRVVLETEITNTFEVDALVNTPGRKHSQQKKVWPEERPSLARSPFSTLICIRHVQRVEQPLPCVGRQDKLSSRIAFERQSSVAR